MRKTAQLCVRMTGDEITVLQELATERSIGLSALVRSVLSAGAETATRSEVGGGLLSRLVGAVHRAGVRAS